MSSDVLLNEPRNLLEFLTFVRALYDEGEKQQWKFVIDAFQNRRPWGYAHPLTEEIHLYTAALRQVAESTEFSKIPAEVCAVIVETHKTLKDASGRGGWKQPAHWND